jgi:3-oxoacyl-[acyl-carrier protein] reductase
MQDITNNVALITGGGTGIGRATGLLLASQGVDIAINYSRSENEAQQTAVEVEELGRRAVVIQADVSDEAAVAKMMDQVREAFGRLDILVNNAATTQMVAYTDLDKLTSEIWDRILAVNVKGTFYCCRDAMPLLRADGGGQIINVSSIAGQTGQGSSIAYAASKAAVINMTKALAVSHAPEVRVNAVAPGVVETRWVQGWEKYTDPHRQRTPLQRHAQPEDVATTIFGLVINPFITGQTITIDGGRTLGFA